MIYYDLNRLLKVLLCSLVGCRVDRHVKQDSIYTMAVVITQCVSMYLRFAKENDSPNDCRVIVHHGAQMPIRIYQCL